MSETENTTTKTEDVDTDVSAIEVDDPIMEIRDASVTFDMDRGKSGVLDQVTLDIERDEILGIVGESGSGKSMFAASLLDAIPEPGLLSGEVTYYPEKGEPVDVLGLAPEELRQLRWEEIAMVFQGAQSSFNPTITLRDHFKETIEAHNYNMQQAMDHARELLTELYLEPDRVLDAYPHELSGGMQQRALIALSLVLEPNVLVMDEPTAALDLLMQRSILSLLENLQEKYDLTVVFITHDLPLVAGLADRLAVMYAFEFAEVGPADEIIRSAAHPYTRSLLQAVPSLDTSLADMRPIEGKAPDPVNVPKGCSYHPRCPIATEECKQEDPGYHEVTDDHEAACFNWQDSSDAIPLSIGDNVGTVADIVGEQSDEAVVSLEDVDIHFEQSADGGILNLFEDPETVHAVDDISLDIYENDVVSLVGESGCGKTTLGKAAIGAQRPTSGSVKYRDQEIWDAKDGHGDVDIPFDEIRRSLQMIHQDPGSSLNPNRKVQASLKAPLERWFPDMDPNDRQERVLSMLEYVGMSPPADYAQRYPHQLSGGEQQRVALIRALLMNPDVILADEAVSALDVSLRVEVMDLMLELQDIFNTSFVFISHNLSNARYISAKAGGRIGVMYLGEIVEIGPAEQIINDPQHPYTKVLQWSTADLDVEETVEDPPLRGIDIPDPVDPPSGCRFHTRCPEAREVCTEQCPKLDDHVDNTNEHKTACFREYDKSHEYWDSEPIVEEGEIDSDVFDNADTESKPQADD
jgi:peptide/nickel transport system ATP-binding protein